MSSPLTQLGSHAFSHSASADTEAEYDRLRGLARQEHDKRASCFDRAHNAYERGDRAAAHELSEEGKGHAQMMEKYNKQASDYIFRENNAVGRVDGDTIDLHGQFVEEAEDILENRIKYAQAHGQTHLHVIVGKGNHSVNHVQKIKPRVEQVCQELHLNYATEDNAGKIYVNLTGGPAQMPQQNLQHGGGYQQPYGQQQFQQPQQQYQGEQQYQGGPQYQGGQQYGGGQQYQQGGYQQHEQQQHGGQQPHDENAKIKAAVKKYLPKVKKYLPKAKKYLPRVMREVEQRCVVM